MKRHLSATDILLNIIRGGIIVAIIVTIVCFYADNTNTSTIVIESPSKAALASDAPRTSEYKSQQSDVSSVAGEFAQDNLTPESKPDSAGLININTATADQLTALKRIGEVKAAAIVEYRQQHGNFTSPDELLNVSGIGEKTLADIRSMITV